MSFKKKSFKTLKCRKCSEPVEKVDADAVAVTCSKCVNLELSTQVHMPEEPQK